MAKDEVEVEGGKAPAKKAALPMPLIAAGVVAFLGLGFGGFMFMQMNARKAKIAAGPDFKPRGTEPLNTSKAAIEAKGVVQTQDAAEAVKAAVAAALASRTPMRRKLPDERQAITHKFDISGHEGYITVGLFEDGMPGEIFLVMAKEGSTISGFADAFAQAISYALQYGVPLQDLVDKFSHVRFEPSGMTKNPDVRFAKSIVDYIFRWMASKFLSQDAQYRAGVNNRDEHVTSPEQLPLDVAAAAGASATAVIASPKTASFAAMQNQEDAPPCSTCGSIMVRSGSCYKCSNCGTTSGCA